MGILDAPRPQPDYGGRYFVRNWLDTQAKIQAKLDANSTGGEFYLPDTTIALSTDPITLTAQQRLIGTGRQATRLTQATAGVNVIESTGAYAGIENLSIQLSPTAGHGIVLGSDASSIESPTIKNIRFSGGSQAAQYCIIMKNPFRWSVTDVVGFIASSGMRVLSNRTDFNYGNSKIQNVDFQHSVADATGFLIEGVQSAAARGRMNLIHLDTVASAMQAGYLGGDSIGVHIINSTNLVFTLAAIENHGTTLKIESGVGGGATSAFNSFTMPYFTPSTDNSGAGIAVQTDAATALTTFYGGELHGSLSDASRDSTYIGVKRDTDQGARDNVMRSIRLRAYSEPQFTSYRYRHNDATRTTIPKGYAVRPHPAVDHAFLAAESSNVTGLLGILVHDSDNGDYSDVARYGLVDVYCTNAVSRGDYIIRDTASWGRCKSNGTTKPTDENEVVGIARAAGTANSLVRCELTLRL